MFRLPLAAVLLSLVAGSAVAQQAPPALPAAGSAAARPFVQADLPPADLPPADLPPADLTPADLKPARERGSLKIGGGGDRLGEPTDNAAPASTGSSMWRTAGALALVLGLIAAAAKWFGKTRAAGGAVGGGTCEVLARVKLEPRASMHVVRIGGRVILVGSAADGLTALGEIDDPAEADALAAACRAERTGGLRRSAATPALGRDSFRTLFGRAAAQPAAPVDSASPEPREPDRSDAERRLAARLRPAGAMR